MTSIKPNEPRPWPWMLVIAASVYSIWFAWLAYVAWVNVSAGNQ